MDSKEYKTLFDESAKINNFSKAHGGWYKESAECIAILELQKSSFSNSFYLNIKIFIQGSFGKHYTPTKDLIKSPIGDITNQIRDIDILNLEEQMADETRRAKLEKLFTEIIVPFTDKALSKSGIRELAEKGEITLLPAVKEELA